MSPVSPLHYFKFFFAVFASFHKYHVAQQDRSELSDMQSSVRGTETCPDRVSNTFVSAICFPSIYHFEKQGTGQKRLLSVISCDVPSKIDVGLSVPSLSGCFCPDFKPFPGAFGIILGLGLLSITLKTHIRAPVHRVIGLDG